MKISYIWQQNLGLCKKAGVLTIGFDAVVEAVKKGEAKGILSATDISLKTLKEIKFYSEKYETEVIYLPADMNEIMKIIGKRAGVMAILDEGLFTLFK